MITTPEHDRCRLIARHVETAYARDRVTRALYEAVLDGLEFGPRDLPLAADREWVRSAIAVAVHETAEETLELLAVSVGRTLERAPTGLLDRFDRSVDLTALGIAN